MYPDFRTGTGPDPGFYALHVVPIDLELDPEGTLAGRPSADALREREMMLELKREAEATSG